MKSYINFDLLIDARDSDTYHVRVLNSPAGQASGIMKMPFTQIEIENFIIDTGQKRSSIRSLDLVNKPEEEFISKFGTKLFLALFSKSIANCFLTSCSIAKHNDKGLRICLRLSGAPELIYVPWEYLFDPVEKRFIGLSVNSPIVRSLDLPISIRPLEIKGALRLLVMISNPKNYPALDVDKEWLKINEATADLQKNGKIIIERLDNASLTTLQRSLRKTDYHIFHYIGHGGFDKSKKDGVLILEGSNSQGKEVSGSYLGTLLYDESTIRLAILNSCDGGRTSIDDPFSGVGQALLQQGIPAVIAMQFEITDNSAITFASEFYNALADSYPVDASLAEARKMIFSTSSAVEWATPVLYMNTDNENIFNIKKKSTNKEYLIGNDTDNTKNNSTIFKRFFERKYNFLIYISILTALVWLFYPDNKTDTFDDIGVLVFLAGYTFFIFGVLLRRLKKNFSSGFLLFAKIYMLILGGLCFLAPTILVSTFVFINSISEDTMKLLFASAILSVMIAKLGLLTNSILSVYIYNKINSEN